MQNVSGGVNQACLEAHLGNEEWRCFFAPVRPTFHLRPLAVHLSLVLVTVHLPLRQDPHIRYQLCV